MLKRKNTLREIKSVFYVCVLYCVYVCVFGERVTCFNLSVQVIITDIINEVIFELKPGDCRQKIIVMDTQSDFYLKHSSDCIVENELKEDTRTHYNS